MYRLLSSIKPWQLEHQGISSIFVEREKKALQFIPYNTKSSETQEEKRKL